MDRITRITSEPLSCTTTPRMLIGAPQESHEKQDRLTGQERSRQAHEHSQQAYQQSELAHRAAMNEHGIVTFGHKEIAILAHRLWEERGCPEGSPEQDWFRAAHQLRARAFGHGGMNATREEPQP